MTFLASLAKELQTTEKNALIRAARLKLTPTCGRCGGSGHYSFNQIDGSRCYGCGGAGVVAPKGAKQEAETLEAAKEVAANGKLASYLEMLRAQKASKNAWDVAMKEWSALSEWQGQRGVSVSNLTVAMCDSNKRISEKMNAIQKLQYGKDFVALEAAMNDALAEIAAIRKEWEDNPELRNSPKWR